MPFEYCGLTDVIRCDNNKGVSFRSFADLMEASFLADGGKQESLWRRPCEGILV